MSDVRDKFLTLAIEVAREGRRQGGIPIGSVLVYYDPSDATKSGKVLGTGHNQRVQNGSVIHHGEMNCLERCGRQPASVYAHCVLYTTLSPCPMCSGAIRLYKIPKVVVGENKTFMGDEALLRDSGVEVVVAQDQECIDMMAKFIEEEPSLWNEDIGV
eukprot:PhM_4_TR10800/c0_g1_i1/m.60541/K01485/codA; cytosine deaminase